MRVAGRPPNERVDTNKDYPRNKQPNTQPKATIISTGTAALALTQTVAFRCAGCTTAALSAARNRAAAAAVAEPPMLLYSCAATCLGSAAGALPAGAAVRARGSLATWCPEDPGRASSGSGSASKTPLGARSALLAESAFAAARLRLPSRDRLRCWRNW